MVDVHWASSVRPASAAKSASSSFTPALPVVSNFSP